MSGRKLLGPATYLSCGMLSPRMFLVPRSLSGNSLNWILIGCNYSDVLLTTPGILLAIVRLRLQHTAFHISTSVGRIFAALAMYRAGTRCLMSKCNLAGSSIFVHGVRTHRTTKLNMKCSQFPGEHCFIRRWPGFASSHHSDKSSVRII